MTGRGHELTKTPALHLRGPLQRGLEGARRAGGERHFEVLEGKREPVAPRLYVGFLARPPPQGRRSGAPHPCRFAPAECPPRPRPRAGPGPPPPWRTSRRG